MPPIFPPPASVRRPVLLTVAFLLTAGCSLTPAYVRPEVQLPATLGALGTTGGPGPVVQRVPLTEQERRIAQTLAPGPELEDILQRGLARNADYQIADLTVERARAELRIQRAQRVPQVDVTAHAQRQHFDDDALDARYQQDLKSVGVGVNAFELDLFGRVKAMSAASRERFVASEHGRQALRGAVVAEILRAYVAEQAAATDQVHARSLQEAAQALLQFAVARQQVGVASTDEVNAYRAAADQAEVDVQRAVDRQRSALRALQILVGYGLVPNRIAFDAMTASSEVPQALGSLDSAILLTRPDVQQAEAELRAANADIGAARAAFFPSITLSTGVGTASEDLGGLFEGGSRSWTFIPQLSLPIFDLGRRRANLDLAHLRKRTEIVEYERTVQAAFREVADALDAVQTSASAQARSTQKAQESHQRAARALTRVSRGLHDPAVAVNARAEALREARSHLDTVRDQAFAQITLFSALYEVEYAPPATASK